MSKITKLLEQMGNSPSSVRFSDLCKVCDHYFGDARQKSSSHRIYKKPWQGDPRLNIQSQKGMAKPYQVRQVLEAVKKKKELEEQ